MKKDECLVPTNVRERRLGWVCSCSERGGGKLATGDSFNDHVAPGAGTILERKPNVQLHGPMNSEMEMLRK